MATYAEVLKALSGELKEEVVRARIQQYMKEADVTCRCCGRVLETALRAWASGQSVTVCVDRPACAERVKGAEKVVAMGVTLLPKD